MPTDDTFDIIAKATEDAGLSTTADDGEILATSPDTPDDDPDTDDEIVPAAAVDDPPADGIKPDTKVEADGDKKPVGDEKVPGDTRSSDDKALDKELEALGLKPPKDGRDNRIPYSRTRKIIGNALKKREGVHQEALGVKDKELTTLREKSTYMDTVDRLIVEQPDQYIGRLATLYPEKYGKYVVAAKTGADGKPAEAVVVPAAHDDPKPGPDARYEDGSTGYTPEGLDKLLEWTARNAVRGAETSLLKKVEEKYGPIEQHFKAGQSNADRAKRVREIVEEQRGIWGEDFTADEALGEKSLINAAWKEEVAAAAAGRRARVPFGHVVAKVMKAKLASDRNKVRQEVLDEQNKTTAERKAAAGAKPGGSKAAKVGAESADESGDSTEAIIRGAMAEAGLL